MPMPNNCKVPYIKLVLQIAPLAAQGSSDVPEGRVSEYSQVNGGERRRLRRHRNGAAYVTRTRDPIITNDVLYQLS